MGRLDWNGRDARRSVASLNIGHLTPLTYRQTCQVTVITITRVGPSEPGANSVARHHGLIHGTIVLAAETSDSF